MSLLARLEGARGAARVRFFFVGAAGEANGSNCGRF